MKILYLIQTSGIGGAEKVLFSLAKHFNINNECIVGLLKKGWLSERLKKAGLRVEIISSGGSFDFKLIKNLINLIKKEKIDLVHSHLLDMNFYSSIASKIAGVKHICTEHGDIHHPSKKLDLGIRIKAKTIAKFSNKIVFVSKFTKDKYFETADIKEKKTAVIYNGIDIEEYQKPVDIIKKKEELGIKGNEFIIGNVGNLYPVKGQIYLIKAAKKVIEENPYTKFLIIGRGELETRLKEETIKLGLNSNILFTGFREDIKEVLRIMDIFVLSSISEGLPISLIEAMACKVPVICTKVGGIPEVIDNGINGYLIPPGDINSISEKIFILIRKQNLKKYFINNGYQKVSKVFEIKNMIRRYQEIYYEK